MHRSPATFSLTDEEMKTLQGWVRQGKAEYRMVERARIVLLANEGRTNQQIADHLHTRTARVSKWRQRFGAHRLAGLGDAPRSGKPARYDNTTEKKVLTLLDQPPPKGNSQWNGNRQPCRMLAGIRYGAFSADMTFACSDAGVGASVPIPSSARRPPMWLGCISIHLKMRWCYRSTRSRQSKRWSERKAICGYLTGKPSTVIVTGTSGTARLRFSQRWRSPLGW